MRISRFLDFVHQLLTLADHPEIARVDTFDDPDTALKPCGVAVTLQDGRVIRLKVVRTAGPGGGDESGEEHIPYPDYQVPEDLKWRLAEKGSAHTVD